jgi:hypothetical protein
VQKFLHHPITRITCCYLALFLADALPSPAGAWASYIQHHDSGLAELDRQAMAALKSALEDELIADQLAQLGLAEEKIFARLHRLTPEEKEMVLAQLETIQAGGYTEGFIVGIMEAYLLYAMVIIFLIALILGGTVKGLDAINKNYEGKRMDLEFYPVEGVGFPSFGGEVKVYNPGHELSGNAVLVGSVYATQRMEREDLLDLMKEEAAANGANILVLMAGDPETVSYNWHRWSARAYRLEAEPW